MGKRETFLKEWIKEQISLGRKPDIDKFPKSSLIYATWESYTIHKNNLKKKYKDDPDHYKKKSQEWNEKNIERKHNTDKKYRSTHREQIKDVIENWKFENRDQYLLSKQKYHQKILTEHPDLYEKWKIQLKKNYDDLRWEILIAYSPNGSTTPVCSCKNCPETLPFFLTIDHENNNGSQHRKEVGTGRQFYKWLKDNDFPLGYRTMCFNCNSGRELMPDKSCPHELL